MQTEAVSPLVAERQRRTWTAIHRAAAEATIARGACDVTVAQIAKDAGISPRTFFNYFDSKEDAIVGVRAPRLTNESLEALRASAGQPSLKRVSRLVTDVARSTIGPGVDLVQRRAIAAAHPALQSRLSQVFTASRKHLITRLVDDADQPWLGIPGLPTEPREARALILLAGSVVTFAWMTDADHLFSDIDGALDDAIATFRKVTSTAL